MRVTSQLKTTNISKYFASLIQTTFAARAAITPNLKEGKMAYFNDDITAKITYN